MRLPRPSARSRRRTLKPAGKTGRRPPTPTKKEVRPRLKMAQWQSLVERAEMCDSLLRENRDLRSALEMLGAGFHDENSCVCCIKGILLSRPVPVPMGNCSSRLHCAV